MESKTPSGPPRGTLFLDSNGSAILTIKECRMSSMFRNIGSAMTFGALETAKAKEAREAYIEWFGRHEERHQLYKDFVTQSAESLEELRKQAQRSRETIIDLGALSVDGQGNLQAGWFPLDASARASNPIAGEREAFLGGAGALAAGIGAPAAAWAAVGALGTASTGAAIGGLSGAAATSATAAWFGGGAVAAGGLGMAAAPFALTGIGLLAAAPVLGVGFWRSRQKERDRLEAIQNSLQEIDDRETEMQEHRIRLESILPEISPAIDELATSATDAKSANDSRLASLATMRSTLTAQCARVADALQEATTAIDNAQGSREELRAISERSRDVTTAAAELQTESNRQEAAVNEENTRTAVIVNKLAAAIESADEIISKARMEGTDATTSS